MHTRKEEQKNSSKNNNNNKKKTREKCRLPQYRIYLIHSAIVKYRSLFTFFGNTLLPLAFALFFPPSTLSFSLFDTHKRHVVDSFFLGGWNNVLVCHVNRILLAINLHLLATLPSPLRNRLRDVACYSPIVQKALQ